MNKQEFNDLELKGLKAAKYYLTRKGWKVLTDEPFECEAGKIEVVAKDEERDGLVFVRVNTRSSADGGQPVFKADETTREMLEAIALAYLEGCDEVDIRLHFDEINITAVSSERAMLRHQFDIL